MLNSIAQRIAQELNVKHSQVEATIELIDGGDTIPFIARYRKEVTGSLDDTQLRLLDERLIYLRELDTYIAERVKELTGGRQHPTTLKPSTISRFPITQVLK